MRLLKRILAGLALAALALAAVLVVNTLRAGSRQIAVVPAPKVAFDEAAAARRLGAAVAIKTISFAPGLPPAAEEFRRFHEHLATSFPKTHATLEREVVNGLSLLYTWRGSDPAAKPVLLMAHQDVVPIAPGTEGQWTQPPFGVTIADGFVWGRGAWDNKGNLMSMLEAVELLAGADFRPRRTLYLAFGHDEEIGGRQGAAKIAEVLKSRGVKAELALDEGLVVTEGIIAGLSQPAALIGIAEKGNVTLTLTAKGVPGHSSMPPLQTAIGTLAAALARLDADPFPAQLSGIAGQTYAALAPEFGGLRRVVLSNLWLTAPFVRRTLEASPATNASLRTTTALTVLQAGEKDNVLPGIAEARVNFRIIPGESIASVTARVRGIVGPAVEVKAGALAGEPSAISSIAAPAYMAIARTIRETFPDAIVAPALMTAATDTRHMTEVAENLYRFTPLRAGLADIPRTHGNDERISVASFAEMIRFYHRLVTNLQAGEPKTAGLAQ